MIAHENALLEKYKMIEEEIEGEEEEIFYRVNEKEEIEETRLEKALKEFKDSLNLTVVGYNRLLISIFFKFSSFFYLVYCSSKIISAL